MSFPRYPDYKDSGIEWLGEVPGHWELVRLKRIAAIQYGIGEPPKYHDDGTPLIRATNVNAGRISRDGLVFIDSDDIPANRITWLSPGDIIVVRSGAYTGDSAIIRSEHCPSIAGFDMVLHPDGCFPDFLQYALLSRYLKNHQIDLEKLRAAQPHLNAEELGHCLIVLPPLSEQATIAAFLDRETGKIDALVAEQEALIALLKEKRQAVISHAVTKGLDPAAPMKDSGIEWLGEVPGHWDVKRLKHIIGHSEGIQMGPFGGMLIDLEDEDTGYRVYGQQNTISGDFDFVTRWISQDRYSELLRYALSPGDIVLTRKGSLGHARLLGDDVQLGIIDSDTIRVRVDKDQIIPELLSLLFHNAPYIEVQINTTKRGAILSGLNTETVASLTIALPPRPEQVILTDHLRDRMKEIDLLHYEALRAIDLLKERRAALISAAVTGKIDVRGLVETQAA
jgi:type I restriction enzyme S subunit